MSLPDAVSHLRAEYAGVLDHAMIRQFVRDYVEPGEAATLLPRVLAPGTPRDLLDVACGFGGFVLLAREAGVAAVGVELAAFELEFARARLRERLPDLAPEDVYVHGDACHLPFENASFDVVTLWNVIEHVPDYERALSEAVRVLRPGGRLIGVAPNYAALRREAHYQVAWLPMLPKRLAAAYLRARGRDPRFLLDHVHYRTVSGTNRVLAALPLRPLVPRADKLDHPERLRNPRLRRLVEGAHRVGLAGLLRRLLAAEARNPVRARIDIDAVKTA